MWISLKVKTLLTLPDLRHSMELYCKVTKLPLLPLQIDDWEWAWDLEQCCICRSRGGSKTFDFVNWLIYRVLRTGENWAWLSAKGGQLTQAMMYFRANPFFKEVKTIQTANSRKTFVELITGKMILVGIISTSNLGMRLDGFIIDEEEDMEYKQSEEIYPQMEGMLTVSMVGHIIHLGTLWIGSRFNDNTGVYPTKIRPWDQLPWLVKAGKIAKILKNKAVPEWEKDLLYRCIPSSPAGLLFNNLDLMPFSQRSATHYGLDFGGEDVCVGLWFSDNHTCYVMEEYAFDLERYPQAADFLRGKCIEGESGGYNDSDKYGMKSITLAGRVGAVTLPVTNQWKSSRQQKAREMVIHIDPQKTPRVYRDLKSAVFGPDGIYLKNNTDHQCHFLDAFFHAIGAASYNVYKSPGKTAYYQS